MTTKRLTMFGTKSAGAMALAVSMGLVLASTARAQDAGSPPPPPPAAQQGNAPAPPPPPPMNPRRVERMQEHQLSMMTRQLNLTPDQVSAVQAIDKDTRTQMAALRDDSSVQGPAKHDQMMKLRDDARTKIRAVLSDDQKTKYDAMLERERERMEERRASRNGAPPAAPLNPPPAAPQS